MQELSVKGNQAFNGAVTHEFPVLGRDFIEYILQQVKPQLGDKAPSIAVNQEAFKRMGSRPEELMKALNAMCTLPQGTNADEHLPTIAESLGMAAADVELQKIGALGPLAEAVFSRICSIGGNVKGGFTANALAEYSAKTGREVTSQEVQSVIGQITSANLLMRVSHGRYGVTNIFVEKAWVERLQANHLLRSDLPRPSRRPMTRRPRAPLR